MDKLIKLSKTLMSDSELLEAKKLKASKLAVKIEAKIKEKELYRPTQESFF